MTDNMTIVQEIKRYLHESKPNSDNSIDVNLSDFPYERRDVFFWVGNASDIWIFKNHLFDGCSWRSLGRK